MQEVIFHGYVTLVWSHMNWSSQKCLKVLIIGTYVLHHLSVRPLYIKLLNECFNFSSSTTTSAKYRILHHDLRLKVVLCSSSLKPLQSVSYFLTSKWANESSFMWIYNTDHYIQALQYKGPMHIELAIMSPPSPKSFDNHVCMQYSILLSFYLTNPTIRHVQKWTFW